MSDPKELNFFHRAEHWNRGLDWYRAHFDPRVARRGESSHNYTKLPWSYVPERMARVLPDDVRFLYIVRDPVARAESHYLHRRARGGEERPIDEALSDLDGAYVRRSRFYAQIAPYLQCFPRERFLVVSSEQLRDHRTEALREIFEFLGVDASFVSPVFAREMRTREDPFEPQDRRRTEEVPPPLGASREVRRKIERHLRADMDAMERFASRRLFVRSKLRAPRWRRRIAVRVAGPNDMEMLSPDIPAVTGDVTHLVAERPNGTPLGVCGIRFPDGFGARGDEAELTYLTVLGGKRSRLVSEALFDYAERYVPAACGGQLRGGAVRAT